MEKKKKTILNTIGKKKIKNRKLAFYRSQDFKL